MYAKLFAAGNKEKAIEPYMSAAAKAKKLGLGINAGHDLNSENLAFFKSKIPSLAEVSIGHALIADALYLGIEKTISVYKSALKD
jgi:pyridoxine 5-phosphate synthase